jgi:hypothetical protein
LRRHARSLPRSGRRAAFRFQGDIELTTEKEVFGLRRRDLNR